MERKGSKAWPLALAHGLNDGFGSFLSALLPIIIERLGLSLAQAGFLNTIRTGIASFGQLPLGLASDRFDPRKLAILGPALTISSMAFLGLAPSYAWLALLLFLAGLGTAAFHPAGASLVPEGGSRTLRMAVFSLGGTLGVALGPLLITQVVSRWGIERVPLLLFPAAFFLGLAGWLFPQSAKKPSSRPRLAFPSRLLHLWGIAMLRDFLGVNLLAFLAVLWTRRGASLTLAGLALTIYAFAEGLGVLMGGRLSERFGKRNVLLGSLVLALPFLYLALLTRGLLSFFLLPVVGLSLASSVPVTVVYGQELAPGQKGLASGLFLGLAWGMGSLLITAVGALADQIGLEAALGFVGLALVPAIFLSFRLPTKA